MVHSTKLNWKKTYAKLNIDTVESVYIIASNLTERYVQ